MTPGEIRLQRVTARSEPLAGRRRRPIRVVRLIILAIIVSIITILIIIVSIIHTNGITLPLSCRKLCASRPAAPGTRKTHGQGCNLHIYIYIYMYTCIYIYIYIVTYLSLLLLLGYMLLLLS